MSRDESRQRAATPADADLTLRVGPEQLVIRRRYETLSILNDFLIGTWFLVGSVAFFWPAWEDAGVWLFVLGSAQLLARPVIRLANHLHLQRACDDRWDM
ncbi:MAG: YrhK family protein [Halofilum sp. (in: g-proteobacteria)]|nr:YrhK family protein [Halofilum sp. (in: g-proteobacteria)]